MRYLWPIVTALAVIFIGVDSVARLRTIWDVSNSRVAMSPVPEEDRASVTGFAGNQHQLVVPPIGMDGYHWIMQTERMVAGAEDWRVRRADYDGPGNGRDVEWGGFLHWEVAAAAWVGTHLTAIDFSPASAAARARNLLFGPYRPGGLPMNLAIARVAPWTNTATLILLLLITVPVAAWRFGSAAASLLALGFAAIYPFYDLFSVGYFDHHGLAATWDLLTVLCLVAGGAGWLRAEATDESCLNVDEQSAWNWLPTRPRARRWFVASAIIGGAGLWESAASTVPVLVGVGIGALCGTTWLVRGLNVKSPWRVDPTLWRIWGQVGCAASVCFYLLEYFPSHFGWNLEINHPLYALAWLGGGDLICRALQQKRARLLIGLDVLMVAALPITIVLTSTWTFVTVDRFLWSLCADYILENQSLFRQLAGMTGAEIFGHISVLPLVLPAALVLLWKAGVSKLPAPWKALLALAVVPAMLLMVLALQQSRWLGLGCAVSLGVLLAMALICTHVDVLGRRSLVAAGVLLALVLLPFPAYTAAQWTRVGVRVPVTQLDLAEIMTRDAAYRLRQRLGREPGVIVSGPSTTTWMTYFGGFKGLGTLYADNLDGLKAVAAIYSAPTADEALALCRKYGVTHLAIFSWDAFAEEYAKLSHGLRRTDPAPADAFILGILQKGTIPSWLRPIPYPTASQEDAPTRWVRLFEVAPDQTVEEATVRVAQYLWAQDKPDAALRQLRPLLAAEPDYLPALICLARVQQSRNGVSAFRQTVQQIRANLGKADTLAFDDRVDLAVVMAFANDSVQEREQLTGALQHADERSVRRLLPDTLVNLVGMTRQLNLTAEYPKTSQLAFDLLPPELKGALSN